MNRFQRLLERRWLIVPLAVAIGSVSGFLLWATLTNDYWNYWIYPREKAGEVPPYIYPQLRYTFFDIVLLLWCLDGLIASGLSFWSVATSRSIALWTYRTILIYFALLAVLLLGGSLMLFVRSRGY
jgi:hypothetical protein